MKHHNTHSCAGKGTSHNDTSQTHTTGSSFGKAREHMLGRHQKLNYDREHVPYATMTENMSPVQTTLILRQTMAQLA